MRPLRLELPHQKSKEGLSMKAFGTQWERVRFGLTPARMRVALAMLTLVAMVLGGSAGEQWD